MSNRRAVDLDVTGLLSATKVRRTSRMQQLGHAAVLYARNDASTDAFGYGV